MDLGSIFSIAGVASPSSAPTSSATSSASSAPASSSVSGSTTSSATSSISPTNVSAPSDLNYSSDFKAYDGYGNLTEGGGLNGDTGDIGNSPVSDIVSSPMNTISFVDSLLGGAGFENYRSDNTTMSDLDRMVGTAQNSDMGRFMTSVISGIDSKSDGGLGLDTFNPTTYKPSDYNDGISYDYKSMFSS